jgi:predicted 3-demethylubiquinone-9 3-methyltransferase (glyoxalase superfamily)
MNKITPFLWFDNNAEEAITLWTAIFKDSKIHSISRYGAGAPLPEGLLFTATVEIEGQTVMVMNAGPHYKLNESFSFYINCKDQHEIDRLWEQLTANGGEESQCGWLKDKCGVSWQIIPTDLGELLRDPDPARAGRTMQAMLAMRKIDVAGLRRAADGG